MSSSGSLVRTESANPQGQVTSVTYSTPEQTQVERQALLAKQQADTESENKRIANENAIREAQLEDKRRERNTSLSASWGTRFREHDDSWSTKPGTGYHFIVNFKGDDGNFYAKFQSNRGMNFRYYSISERKWYSEYVMNAYRCDNCNERMMGLAAYDKTCPKCGTTKTKGTSY